MRRAIGLFLIVSVFSSCSDGIQNNSRISLHARVVDQMQQPLPNIDIVVGGNDQNGFTPTNRFFYTGDDSIFDETLGYNVTNANGEARLISLRPSKSITLGVVVNPEEAENEWSTSIVRFDSIPEDLIVIQQITLTQRANLSIEFDRDTASQDTLYYQLRYNPDVQYVIFPEVNTLDERIVSGSQTIEDTETSVDVNALFNSRAILSYRLVNGDQVIREQVEIPITQTNQVYAISF